MTSAARRCTWFVCILLLCLCNRGVGSGDASDVHAKEQEESHTKDREPRSLLTLRGQSSQSSSQSTNKDGMTAKRIAKMQQVEKKKMQMLARRRKKESMQQNRMRTSRGSHLKPQYDSQQHSVNSPPMMRPPPPLPNAETGGQYGPPPMDEPPPPPPMMEAGQYGSQPPPPMNIDGQPPPMTRPPPPVFEGGAAGYEQVRPPPLLKGPPLPMIEPERFKSYGSKSSNIPIKPGYPIYKPFPPGSQHPPGNQFPPPKPLPPYPIEKPTFMPTYSPTKEVDADGIQITIQGLLNTYGLMFPLSSEGYDRMVAVFEKTIYESAGASLGDNQMVTQVRVLEIEGITPQFSGESRRELQNVDSNTFQCTIVEQQQCCAREPPKGQGNPAQYCESLGCSMNQCRRVRFDVVAEQLPPQGSSRKLQSQNVVEELYAAITQSITDQINSGAFTIRLKENASLCGDSCMKPFTRVTVISAVFAPPTLITALTEAPTQRPTPKPVRTPKPIRKPRPPKILFPVSTS